MSKRISPGVLAEYRRIAGWLETQAALRGPAGDTMHGLAAEALNNLLAQADNTPPDCPQCGCDIRYPNTKHILDCKEHPND